VRVSTGGGAQPRWGEGAGRGDACVVRPVRGA
jgi:hypothetical protein